MTFEELRNIQNESEQVNKTYEIFNEDTRLNRSKAARVEFLTTVRVVEQYLKPGDKILDIGAGAGEYSLYFAKKGYQVDSLELSDSNIATFKRKLTDDLPVCLRQGNALDLSCYENDSFDLVLLFGPLYHLHKEEDRQKCIAEAKRVCKPDGTLCFAYITNDMVILTEFVYEPDYFKGSTYDHDTFELEDFPFVFANLDECREGLKKSGVKIVREVASDGVSEMLAEKINAMDEESYKQYLKYHFYLCEKPEMLGHSNHLLFVGKK